MLHRKILHPIKPELDHRQPIAPFQIIQHFLNILQIDILIAAVPHVPAEADFDVLNLLLQGLVRQDFFELLELLFVRVPEPELHAWDPPSFRLSVLERLLDFLSLKPEGARDNIVEIV